MSADTFPDVRDGRQQVLSKRVGFSCAAEGHPLRQLLATQPMTQRSSVEPSRQNTPPRKGGRSRRLRRRALVPAVRGPRPTSSSTSVTALLFGCLFSALE